MSGLDSYRAVPGGVPAVGDAPLRQDVAREEVGGATCRNALVSPPPCVSVLMAVYNGQPYVREAVESILGQTLRDFEFIIINDGSTDGSEELLRQYARQDARIRLIDRENRGFVPSLNEGLELARGDFVARIDADDVALPHRLEEQAGYLRAHPECVLVGGFWEMMDGKGRAIRGLRLPVEHAEIDGHQLHGRTSVPHCVATFRREAQRRVGPYNRAFESAEDLDLWLRLGEVGKLHNIPRVLMRYREHEGSMSSMRAEAQLAAMRGGCEAAWRRRNVLGSFEQGEHWRPGKDRASRLRYALAQGWSAFMAGHRRTAWVYGGKAVRISPLAKGGWKLLACAALKPRREEERGW